MMSNEEAIRRKYEYRIYNPYYSRKDIVIMGFILGILLFNTLFGLFYLTKFFFIFNSVFAISIFLTLLIEYLLGEKIKKEKGK